MQWRASGKRYKFRTGSWKIFPSMSRWNKGANYVLLIQCWLGDGVSFLGGDVVLTKKSKQRGHIQKTSDHYIPSFIDLNKFSSRNVFFPLRYYRPGQIDFWLFKISFASAKNPSSEKVMSLAPLAFGSFVHDEYLFVQILRNSWREALVETILSIIGQWKESVQKLQTKWDWWKRKWDEWKKEKGMITVDIRFFTNLRQPIPSMSYPLSLGWLSYVMLWITPRKDMRVELSRNKKK